MAQYSPLSGESLFDVAVKLYSDTALGIQDLLSLNVINLDSDLYGTTLEYTEGLSRVKPVFPTVSISAKTEVYTTRSKQTVYDLAIQLYGSLSHIGNLLEYFPNLDTEIPVGSAISLTEVSDPVAVYFKDRNMIVATDLVEEADDPFTDHILTELGDYVLLETGDKILIE